MGYVWNVMLSFDNEELSEDGEEQPRESCEPLERINAWLPHGRLVSLVGPTFKKNAGYGMDANLFGGGFKHFDIEGFIEVVKAQDWKARSRVQLWIKGGEEGMSEEPFALIELGGGQAASVGPGMDNGEDEWDEEAAEFDPIGDDAPIIPDIFTEPCYGSGEGGFQVMGDSLLDSEDEAKPGVRPLAKGKAKKIIASVKGSPAKPAAKGSAKGGAATGKAAVTRKHRAAGAKAAKTKKRQAATLKAAATRKSKLT